VNPQLFLELPPMVLRCFNAELELICHGLVSVALGDGSQDLARGVEEPSAGYRYETGFAKRGAFSPRTPSRVIPKPAAPPKYIGCHKKIFDLGETINLDEITQAGPNFKTAPKAAVLSIVRYS
jgi:hypothetical protein